MFELFVTDAANRDLDSIIEYIAIALSNPLAARKLLDKIELCYRNLRTTPLMYEKLLGIAVSGHGANHGLEEDDMSFVNLYLAIVWHYFRLPAGKHKCFVTLTEDNRRYPTLIDVYDNSTQVANVDKGR